MATPLRILIVEDSESDAELLLRQLRQSGFAPIHERVETADQLRAALAKPVWDIIISDYALPDFNGLEALQILQSSGVTLPFIIVSGTIGEDIAVEAMRAGANDYLIKGQLARLGPAVERELREAELHRQRRRDEERLRDQARLLDLAQDAIVVRDLEDRVRYWNCGAERLFGWTAAEAVGCKVSELMCHDSELFEAAKQKVLSQDNWGGELHHQNKTGQEITVSSRWTLLRDAQGNPKSVLSINTDLTEHKKLEEQFLRAQRLEGIGLLASGIAHDLNNILAPIMMSASILRSEPLSPEGEEIVSTIESSAQRGADIVRQLLTFGRGIAGERVVVQVHHLVKDMVKVAQETFPKNISFQEITSPDLWPVLGDATHIHQILLNLCINARDAMPTGGILKLQAGNLVLDEVQARNRVEAREGPYLLLQVVDTGLGMTPEIIEKIFDPFFTTKPFGQGTGLGLSTVLGIVKSHGGFVEVQSRVGCGTTFSVYLPATPNAQAPAEPPPASALPRGRGELILVVDDEARIRTMARTILEKYGYTVETAGDGAEAIAVWTQHRTQIKAVLTDMMMPVMDGLNLARVLRRTNPQLLIIASSGMGSNLPEDHQAQLQALAVTAFLNKPYSTKDLLETLHRLLPG